MQFVNAALISAVLLGVANADTLNPSQVVFVTNLVNDFKSNQAEYLGFLATASGVPTQLPLLAGQVITYTDDSYTNLLNLQNLDLPSLEAYATNLPWFTRIEADIANAASGAGAASATADASSGAASSAAPASSAAASSAAPESSAAASGVASSAEASSALASSAPARASSASARASGAAAAGNGSRNGTATTTSNSSNGAFSLPVQAGAVLGALAVALL